jgi:RNA recognition motif-containing protein
MSNTIDQRTVFVDGFSDDVTEDSIRDFFTKHGTAKSIHMRKDKSTNAFRGSVYIEFETAEQAKLLTKKKNLKFNKKPLVIKSKIKYIEEANNKLKETNAVKHNNRLQSVIEKAKKEFKFDEGSLVHITNIGRKEKVVFIELKDLFKEYGVAFVEFPYNSKKSESVVRFNTAASAKIATEALQKNETKIGGNIPTLTILKGSEEKAILDNMIENKVRKQEAKKHRKGEKRKQKADKKRKIDDVEEKPKKRARKA